jgi:uncharacterized protein YrrD
MLFSIKDLRGMSIHATDGDLGKADDFYFDDQDWTIRYVVADVGSWLERHKVLISPAAVQTVAPDLKRFMTELTKEQVKNSPDWDTDKPVSRQYEALFSDYYKYPYYWGGPALWGYAPYPAGAAVAAAVQAPPAEEVANIKAEIAQSHLRSTNAVSGYAIETADGEIGDVHDFIIDERSWQIHYLVIDTGKWLPGRKVLLSPRWINDIDWANSKVKVQLDRETIKNAPGYDNPTAITRAYEERLFAYYNRPGYWEKARGGMR